MRIELPIDLAKELPQSVVPTLEKELLKRLQNQFAECSLVIRRAGSNWLNVYGGEKEAEQMVDEIIQKTWESADNWFY
ncbi:DinI family protein [Enterobacter sp. RD4-1-1]|uniref:DinI family protein n=1 Tax=Enterobacter sp. RD4-1-1 TaxID=2986135 RepID=UPI0021E999D4|nr:DinI family protein [Enterobacter sp. RD4-1-1]MCV3771457.1 DinI family protein [Enterobacter sp. RD4-1-1]